MIKERDFSERSRKLEYRLLSLAINNKYKLKVFQKFQDAKAQNVFEEKQLAEITTKWACQEQSHARTHVCRSHVLRRRGDRYQGLGCREEPRLDKKCLT